MLSREKMFVIASMVDDTIVNQSKVYDITLFKTFTEFKDYIEKVPTVISTLVVSTEDLPFSASAMREIGDILASPFLKIEQGVIYLVDTIYDLKIVKGFVEEQGWTNWACYQGIIDTKFVTDIISGEGRDSNEGQYDVVTYRIRTAEYAKMQNQKGYKTVEDHYKTDEEDLMGIPDEEVPEDITPTTASWCTYRYIVGKPGHERTLFAFICAQYYSLNSKTLIVERDQEYHRLTEYATKSGVEFTYIEMRSLLKDITATLNKIKASPHKLIIVGSKEKVKYDYNFIADLLYSNLMDDIVHFVRECDFGEAPYGRRFVVTCPNTVPDILEACNNLQCELHEEEVVFVGVQLNNLGSANLTSREMTDVLQVVFEKNNVAAQVLRSNGLQLKGDNSIYDILGIIVGNNGR